MDRPSSDYRLLKTEGNDRSPEMSSGDDEDGYSYVPRPDVRKYPNIRTLMLLISLAVSLVLNAFLVMRLKSRASHNEGSSVSPYGQLMSNHPPADLTGSIAQLEYNVPTPFEWHTDYNGEDQARANELWDALGTEIDSGFIAVSDEWAAEKDLLEAQRFPWDTSKGIYLVNGQHNLHCLVCTTSGSYCSTSPNWMSPRRKTFEQPTWSTTPARTRARPSLTSIIASMAFDRILCVTLTTRLDTPPIR